MAEFLTDEALTEAIRHVVGGKGVKCAVAFWGNHGFFEAEALGGVTKDWQIICDIQMGGTSRDALVKLGAPTEPNLKFRNGLHAKVYISDRGVVVGSANASARGLGVGDNPASLLEAGMFHKHGGKAWRDATVWFDEIFGKADQVDETALREADRRYRPPLGISVKNSGMSLLEQVKSKPDYFAEQQISFAISTHEATPNELKIAADQSYEARGPQNLTREELYAWPPTHIFHDWLETDIQTMDKFIVEFYIGKNDEVQIFYHRIVHRFERVSENGNGHVYTKDPIGSPVGVDSIITTDRPQSLSVSDRTALICISKARLPLQHGQKSAGGIFRARKFSELLDQAYHSMQSQPKS